MSDAVTAAIFIPERMPDEPSLWYDRFLLYAQMGPSRSVLGTFNAERAQKGAKRVVSLPGAWQEATKKWEWKKRAEAYDELRRKHIFTQGYASELVRVEKMDKLAQALEARIAKMLLCMAEPEKGKAKFNSFLYDMYLKTLDAIAQETGGRVKKQEITGANGGPLDVLLYLPEQEQEGEE